MFKMRIFVWNENYLLEIETIIVPRVIFPNKLPYYLEISAKETRACTLKRTLLLFYSLLLEQHCHNFCKFLRYCIVQPFFADATFYDVFIV